MTRDPLEDSGWPESGRHPTAPLSGSSEDAPRLIDVLQGGPLEAYKVRDELARRGIGISTWADWWGFKMEAYDGIPENAALCHKAGVNVAIHSDSSDGVQRLWLEAAKCVRWGMPEDAAMAAITITIRITNPKWSSGANQGEFGDVSTAVV